MSSFLTGEKAIQHCRACLININNLENLDSETLPVTVTQDQQLPLFIDLRSSQEILHLFCILTDTKENQEEEIAVQHKNVCVDCFRILEEFEKFRKRLLECDKVFKAALVENIEEDLVQNGTAQKATAEVKFFENAEKEEEDNLMREEIVHHPVESVFIFESEPFNTKGVNNTEFLTRETPALEYNRASFNEEQDTEKHHGFIDEEDALLQTEKSLGFQETTTLEIPRISDTERSTEKFNNKEHSDVHRNKECVNEDGNDEEFNDDVFECNQCKRKFLYKYIYEAHLRGAHQAQLKRPYSCDHCDKRYKSVDTLRYHLHKVHNSNGQTFICTICKKIYKTAASLKQHHRDQHLGQKQRKTYICEYCGAGFIGTKNLENHYAAKHGEISGFHPGRYECSVCKRRFNNAFNLQYHSLRQHATDNMLQCECSICGIKFAKKFMLVAHMRAHASVEDKFECDQCGRLFTQKFDVVQHIRVVHMKVKPYHCSHCSRSFGTEKTLRHHIYTHTGEKPYQCKICGRPFRQPSALKTHMKSRH